MTALSSALAQTLAAHTEADVLQAMELYYSLHPQIQEPFMELLKQVPPSRYYGHIVSFDQTKGHYGFISSVQANADFGKDVFCSSEEIGNFRVGDEVSFTVVLNKNNQPQARLLQGRDGVVAASATGVSDPAKKRQRTDVDTYAYGDDWAKGNSRGPSYGDDWGKGQGKSQSYGGDDWGKGQGYVAPAAYGGQTWQGYTDRGGCKGHVPQAQVVPPPPTPVKPLLVRPPPARPPPQAPRFSKPAGEMEVAADSARYVGSILSFNPMKSFGFIGSAEASQSYGKDVFLSSLEIKNFGVGDTVSFEIALNKNGNPQARNLQAADGLA